MKTTARSLVTVCVVWPLALRARYANTNRNKLARLNLMWCGAQTILQGTH